MHGYSELLIQVNGSYLNDRRVEVITGCGRWDGRLVDQIEICNKCGYEYRPHHKRTENEKLNDTNQHWMTEETLQGERKIFWNRNKLRTHIHSQWK